jgi:diguanylate cyclase (GGDEF)-like protein
MDFSGLKYISTDSPTTDELELLNESRVRIAQVIRARWIILGILAAYGIVPYAIFQYYSIDLSSINTLQFVFPVLAWCAMATYNAFFLYSYQWFANIRPLNQIQLLLDLLFVTVVIHFSGGAVSWFWPMYLIVTLESVLVMEKYSDTFAFALGASLAYGWLLQLEFYGIIRPVSMPFESLSLQQNIAYDVTKWAWVTMINMSVAVVGVYLMKTIRHREDELKRLVIKDNLTALYNRAYFNFRLNSEVQRAKRYNRALSLLILDLDNFKQVNDRYGHLIGDQLLHAISSTIRSSIRYSTGKTKYELDIPCRYGGDEFAIILPETTPAQAIVAAERLRKGINVKCGYEMKELAGAATSSQSMEVPNVTVSVGVASFPDHASDSESLVKAADNAMYVSKRSEKDKVVVSETALASPLETSPLAEAVSPG